MSWQARPQLSHLVGSSSAVCPRVRQPGREHRRPRRRRPAGRARADHRDAGQGTAYAGDPSAPRRQHLRPPPAGSDRQRRLEPFARTTAPILRRPDPAVRASRTAPLVRTCGPPPRDSPRPRRISAGSFGVLNAAAEHGGLQPERDSRARAADTRSRPGLLYWIAWVDHQAVTSSPARTRNGDRPAALHRADCDDVPRARQGAAADGVPDEPHSAAHQPEGVRSAPGRRAAGAPDHDDPRGACG